MTISEWYTKWAGKLVPSRGGITGQCVSLVQKYAEEVLGTTGTPVFSVRAAKDMVGARPDAFTWIANTPTGVPPYGAIVVFNGRTGGGYGHTGVAIEGCDLNTVRVIQQNDPAGSGASIKVYNYTNVSGWLVPKITNNGGGDGMMNQGENEFARANDLHLKLRGRALDRNIFNQLAGKITWLRFIEICSDDPEAVQWQQNATVGKTARADQWERQIQTLIAQVKDMQKQIDDLKKQSGTYTEADRAVAAETNNIVKNIWAKITNIFK